MQFGLKQVVATAVKVVVDLAVAEVQEAAKEMEMEGGDLAVAEEAEEAEEGEAPRRVRTSEVSVFDTIDAGNH